MLIEYFRAVVLGYSLFIPYTPVTVLGMQGLIDVVDNPPEIKDSLVVIRRPAPPITAS